MVENWIQKIKLGSDNLSVYARFIVVTGEKGRKYLFNAEHFAKSLQVHKPEDVEVVENNGLLQFKKDDGLLDWLVAIKNENTMLYEPYFDPCAFKNFVYRELKNKPQEYRDGQFVFNFLDTIIPNISREIQFNKKIDCFYLDSKIQEFLDAAVEILKEKIWL